MGHITNFQSLKKKEVDWDRSNEDKGGETLADYRMQHEPVCIFVNYFAFKGNDLI